MAPAPPKKPPSQQPDADKPLTGSYPAVKPAKSLALPSSPPAPAQSKTRRQKMAKALGGDSEFSVSSVKPAKAEVNLNTEGGGPSYSGGRWKKWHFLRKIFR